jgi:hypothetical protein
LLLQTFAAINYRSKPPVRAVAVDPKLPLIEGSFRPEADIHAEAMETVQA